MKIIDAHAHLGVWPFPIEQVHLTALQEILDKFGFYRTIVSSARAILYDMEEGNREVAEAASQDERILGLIFVNPNLLEKSISELERWGTDSRFVGVKYHPSYVKLPVNAPENQPLLEKIAELRLPLCVHTWGRELGASALDVARKYSNLKLVCFHMGWPDYEDLLEKARPLENVSVEIAVTGVEHNRVRRAVEVLGKERVLFGTDTTLLNPARMLGLVEESRLTAEEKEFIFHRNAERVFKIS